MRKLPDQPLGDIDLYEAYRPADPRGELLRMNLITTLDGHAADREGRTGSLGSPGDRALIGALRALADGILVGAQTARVEGYGPHRPRAALAERRRADGRGDAAAMVVVSRSLRFDPGAALFSEQVAPTIIVTCAAAPAERRQALGRIARVLVTGEERVDLAEAVGLLRIQHGLRHLLCEGGPILGGQLVDAGLVDELCLTVAPRLVGGAGPRVLESLRRQRSLALTGLYEEDGYLFTRYSIDG